jgi:NAD(P)H-dependent FMN reductase
MIFYLHFLFCPINIHALSGAIINLFKLMSWAWWHMLSFLVLMEGGRSLWVLCQFGLHRVFQDIQGNRDHISKQQNKNPYYK